ncbi:ENTH-domain-containing protein [Laetiporus sulphureus 93-53]|uniref:ENTH-domain-containing protein n=1 Tax=Laetiporus sulphureus 93-53 TaxID=1314785 RepID=A0A165HTJ9_9APHY|nr:ENTH-domain-containing protein [Laetiporus sulphureus 93-53]KZT12171.1 ENTH-domain-containing protein [Laetiporus sulphureus 93-53]
MDRLESLSNTLSNITLYDIKSVYNQAKNVVFNVSEMEAKVREATNDEPWGASSTLMQEIAQGTFNFQHFNEIMPAIYARFMEKEARQWRQIYKALQLLEYLVKNGSERVVDDARSHIATIKMLRNFYYIDDKGKDQGLNVRNRSRELVELLSDVDKIRTERRKAKTNKHKYIGTGNDPMSLPPSGGRYGGFGNDSFGYSGGYGGGSSSSGGDYGSYSGSSFRDDTGRRGYQEYDAGDDETLPKRSNSVRSVTSPSLRRSSAASATPPATSKPPEPAQEVDLLGMDDDAFGSTATSTSSATNKALPELSSNTITEGDDEFDDFQTAPTAASAGPAVQPTVPRSSISLQQSEKTTSPPLFQQPAQTMSPPLFQQLQRAPLQSLTPPLQRMSPTMPPMNRANGSFTAMTPTRSSFMTPTTAKTVATPVRSATSPFSGAASKPAPSANFEDLWSMSLGSSGSTSAAKTPTASSGASKSMKDLEKEKVQAGIWGSGQSTPPMGAGFGSFGNNSSTPSTTNAAPASSSSSPLDDLLF